MEKKLLTYILFEKYSSWHYATSSQTQLNIVSSGISSSFLHFDPLMLQDYYDQADFRAA